MTLGLGLEDRVVLVTGAGGGIGSAVSLEVAAQGAKVAVLDSQSDNAESTVAAIEALGGTAVALVCDVRSEESMSPAIDAVEERLGPIFGVVTCAGLNLPGRADLMPIEDWDTVIGVNLTGTFITSRLAARKMLPRGEGAMVLIGSTDSLGGQDSRAHYAASKHAVIGLGRSLAADWGRSGLRVNVVCPGPVDTPLLHRNNAGLIDELFLPRMPIKRLAQGSDQARAVTYLLSDYSDYITGAVLAVDGGLSAGYLTNFKD